MRVKTVRSKRVAAGTMAAALMLSACGGGGDPTTTANDPAAAASANAADQAEANASGLQSTDDGRTTEVLSIADGSITNLQQVVTGDRPVLLWFWAPH